MSCYKLKMFTVFILMFHAESHVSVIRKSTINLEKVDLDVLRNASVSAASSSGNSTLHPAKEKINPKRFTKNVRIKRQFGNKVPKNFTEAFKTTLLKVMRLEHAPSANSIQTDISWYERDWMRKQSLNLMNEYIKEQPMSDILFPTFVRNITTNDGIQQKLLTFWLPNCTGHACQMEKAKVKITFRGKRSRLKKKIKEAVVHLYLINRRDKSVVKKITSQKVNLQKHGQVAIVNFSEAIQEVGKLLQGEYGIAVYCVTCDKTVLSTTKQTVYRNNKTVKSLLIIVWRRVSLRKRRDLSEWKVDRIENTNKSIHVVFKRDTENLVGNKSFKDNTTSAKRVKNTFQKKRQRREKQSTPDMLCQLRRRSVNFATIGWHHWIVHPAAFHFEYCSGSCVGQDFASEVSSHAFLLRTLHNKESKNGVSGCCVPTSFKLNVVLYRVDNNQIHAVNLPTLSASSCGCA